MAIRVRQQLEKALLYIDEHLEIKLTVTEIAKTAYMSDFHFQRIFSAYMGESLSQYVSNRRLELVAKKLINQKSIPIAEIAATSGFESHSNFSRAFKKHFELTPNEFRTSPDLAKLGDDKVRPYLKTTASGLEPLDVAIDQRLSLWFNYKTTDSFEKDASFHNNIIHIAHDMNRVITKSSPHLFAVGSTRIEGYSSTAKNVNDFYSTLLYGGIYGKKLDDDWSDQWCEIESGMWAICNHKGNYEYTYQTWNRLIRSWLPESGYELRQAKAFERYLSSPILEKNCDNWISQLYLPIQKS